MTKDVSPGIYRHFKGSLYRVYGTAINSETSETFVVYRALYGEKKLYIRPFEMFISKVDRSKYPDVGQSLRFELLKKEDYDCLN